jgi:hypothetical protein
MNTALRRLSGRAAAVIMAAPALGLVALASSSAVAAPARSASRHAVAHGHSAGFVNRVFANGDTIFHATAKGRQAVSKPDDITSFNGDIYVAFANGLGPQGQASPSGATDSTVVAFSPRGRVVRQWDIAGKCDGLTADPLIGQVIATVNEDANSSLYVIDPHGAAAHYHYSAPIPSKGGTDAISIYHGTIIISGSAPGTNGKSAPQPSYPAVYRAVLNRHAHSVTLHGVFPDTARAREANGGSAKQVSLALTDPDSSAVLPSYAGRFGGDFMLTSQGDEEQIFTRQVQGKPQLHVLKLARSVDDTGWPSGARATLYATDTDGDTIDRVTGPFRRGEEISAITPCDQNNAPSTCPGSGFPANYLGAVNSNTGAIARLTVSGPALEPQGLLFVG